MPIRLDHYIAELLKKRQQPFRKRTAGLIAEEARLRQLPDARERSQVGMAEKLHVKQAAVSKLERRADMYLSTLRSYFEAMGRKLEIIARFPQRAARIMQFDALDPERRQHRSPGRGKKR